MVRKGKKVVGGRKVGTNERKEIDECEDKERWEVETYSNTGEDYDKK